MHFSRMIAIYDSEHSKIRLDDASVFCFRSSSSSCLFNAGDPRRLDLDPNPELLQDTNLDPSPDIIAFPAALTRGP